MSGTTYSGILMSEIRILYIILLVLLQIQNPLLAQANNSKTERLELIELSLRPPRNPTFLDSLGRALLQYDDDESRARGYFLKGLSATFKGAIDSASNNYLQSLALIPLGGQYDKRFTYFMVLKNVGISYYRRNRQRQGDSIFNSMAKMALESSDSFHYASALSNLGNGMILSRNFEGAIEKLMEAILIEEALGSSGVSSSYLKIGTIFGRMNQPEEALVWFRKSKAVVTEDNLRLQGRIFNNIAVAWRTIGDIDSAQYYLMSALAIHTKTGSKIDQAMVYENLSLNAFTVGNISEADSLLEMAYSILPTGDGNRNSSISRLWMLSFKLSIAKKEVIEAEKFMKLLEGADYKVLQEVGFLQLKADFFELNNQKDSAIYWLKVRQARESELSRINDAAKIKQGANVVELAEITRKQKVAHSDSFFPQIVSVIALSIMLIVLYFLLRRMTNRSHAALFSGSSSGLAEGILVKDEYQELKAQKLGELAGQSDEVLKLKSKAIIKVADILYLQSEGHYVNIYLVDRENPEVERISLSALLIELGEDSFQRIHRSYAVNVAQLKAIYSTRVLLNNGIELPVTRTYNAVLQERFNRNEVK
jgi:tetratricopeptide (TPR) repeat protein